MDRWAAAEMQPAKYSARHTKEGAGKKLFRRFMRSEVLPVQNSREEPERAIGVVRIPEATTIYAVSAERSRLAQDTGVSVDQRVEAFGLLNLSDSAPEGALAWVDRVDRVLLPSDRVRFLVGIESRCIEMVSSAGVARERMRPVFNGIRERIQELANPEKGPLSRVASDERLRIREMRVA